MYYVKNWKTRKAISEHKKITKARYACRKLGHTGEVCPDLRSYYSTAYVADDNDDLVYDPHFSKRKS